MALLLLWPCRCRCPVAQATILETFVLSFHGLTLSAVLRCRNRDRHAGLVIGENLEMRLSLAFAWSIILLSTSIAGADDAAKGDAKIGATTERDPKRLGQLHDLMGKIVKVKPSDKTLTIEVAYQLLEPKNKNALSKMNAQQKKIYKEQQQLLSD
jgi:hypothetical protein